MSQLTGSHTRQSPRHNTPRPTSYTPASHWSDYKECPSRSLGIAGRWQRFVGARPGPAAQPGHHSTCGAHRGDIIAHRAALGGRACPGRAAGGGLLCAEPALSHHQCGPLRPARCPRPQAHIAGGAAGDSSFHLLPCDALCLTLYDYLSKLASGPISRVSCICGGGSF